MPKRLKSVQIEEASINYVRGVFTSMNWNSNPVESDFGVDLHVKVFDETTRESAPWEFKVQVKGTEHLRVKKGDFFHRIDIEHVYDWISGHLPVLFVLCKVHNYKVVTSYFVWVDKFVYEKLKWPIGVDSLKAPKTISLKLSRKDYFDAKCRNDLLEYIQAWSPMSRSIRSVGNYLSKISQEKFKLYDIRSEVLKFSLFALKITYRRKNQGLERKTVTDEKDLFRVGRRILLLGKPATGKTITVDRLTARPPNNMIPISITEKVPAEKDGVYEHIRQKAGISSQDHVRYLQSQGRFLLIIDSLNEFHRYKNVVNSINKLAIELPQTWFIITCRTFDYDLIVEQAGRLRPFEKWEISDLDEESQERFLKKQSDYARKCVLNAFDQQPRLRELCSNPFFFLLAVELIPSLKGQRVWRADLYENFLYRYLKWVKVEPLEMGPIIELLSRIAFTMRKSQERRTLMTNSALNRLIAGEIKERKISLDRKSLKTKLEKHGLIEKFGKDKIRFFQETLQEYLCAYFLASNGVLPCDIDDNQGRLTYDGMELNDMIRSFYIELGGFDRLILENYRDEKIWR